MTNFILAMTLYPEVQERAQRELDDVIGRDRLPSFSDKSRLPFVSKVVKETLRWKAVSPLGQYTIFSGSFTDCLTGVPHATVENDVYRGGFIPKGTTVIANISCVCYGCLVVGRPDLVWAANSAMLHDPTAYSDPDTFNPDRFSPTDKNPEGEPDPARAVFGFGRRWVSW